MENFKISCLILITITLSVLFAYFTNYKECEAKADVLSYKFNYGFFQGCVLEKPNGDKILLEKLRYNELD